MKNLNVKSAFLCARTDFVKWLFGSRMIILTTLAVFVYVSAVSPLTDNAKLMGKALNVIEPYIAALNSSSLLLMIPLGFLAVCADFPLRDGSAMFSIFRLGKANWLFGQLANLIMISAAYLLFILAASFLPVAFTGFYGGEWSDVTLYFGTTFPEYSQNYGALLLPKNLYNQMPLIGAAVQSTLFVFAYLILLGVILLCFTVIGKKTLGLIICGGLIATGSALCSIGSGLMWAFPMANSVVWLHFTEFRREQQYPTWASILYFGGLILTLVIISLIRLKRFDCIDTTADE